MIKSPLKFDVFYYKHGLRYIVVHKHLTGDLHVLAGVLPYRRKVNGVTPVMTGREINSKEDDPEYQGIFPKRNLTELHKREIVGRVCEIGLKVVL